MEWRQHDFYKLLYVLEGRGRLHLRGCHPTPFSSGDVLWVRHGHQNRLEDQDSYPVSLYALCVRETLVGFDVDALRKINTGGLHAPRFRSQQIRRELRQIAFRQSSWDRSGEAGDVMDLIARTLSVLRCVWLMHQVNSQPNASETVDDRSPSQHKTSSAGASTGDAGQEMSRYVAELPERFFECTTIDDAAAELNMSRRRFTQLFRQQTGTTWLLHVRELAIRHAEHLLLRTKRSTISIAFECGFDDVSTFYRWFKRLRHVAPGTFREKHHAVGTPNDAKHSNK